MADAGSLGPYKKGDVLKASDLNTIVEVIRKRLLVGPDGTSLEAGGSVSINFPQRHYPSDVYMAAQVVSHHGDYLMVKRVDSKLQVRSGAAAFAVMKVWDLRRSPFEGTGDQGDGHTYTYNSDSERVSDGSETQQITPDYFAGAIVYLFRQNISEEWTTGKFTQWVDSNRIGRQWCEPE